MRRRDTPAPRGRRSRRTGAGRRTIAVFGVCAAAAALPVGLAESAAASSGSSSNPVVTVDACPGGLQVGVLGIGVTVGESCPTAPATPMPPPTPSAAPTVGIPTPSIGPPGPLPTEPQPTAVDICTLPPPPSPKVAVVVPTPAPVIAAPVITPTPTPTPAPTKPKPTPKPSPPKATPTLVVVQVPAAYHAVPFHKINPVLIVFVVAIVPVTLARIRRRGR